MLNKYFKCQVINYIIESFYIIFENNITLNHGNLKCFPHISSLPRTAHTLPQQQGLMGSKLSGHTTLFAGRLRATDYATPDNPFKLKLSLKEIISKVAE